MVVLVMEEYEMDPVGMAGKNRFHLIRLRAAFSFWLSSVCVVMKSFIAYHSKREAAAVEASSIHPPLQQPEDLLGKLSVLFIRSGL